MPGWAAPRNFESGISSNTGVDLAIQRLTDGKWWDGVGFDLGARKWNPAVYSGASSGTWTYSLPNGAIADGTTYYAMSRVRDQVSNLQIFYTTNYFTGDTTPPSSLATAPSGVQSEILTITGTAQDTLPGELRNSNMAMIALRRTSAPQACYDNATNSWPNCPALAYPNDRIWFATGTVDNPRGQPGNWTWDTSAITWWNNAAYDVQALAMDKAGNTRPTPGQNSPDITFGFASPLSQTTFLKPASEWGNYKSADLGLMQGNGTNLRTSNSVQLRIKRLKEPAVWWNESSQTWVASDTYTYVTANGGAWSMGVSGATAFTVDNASYTFSSVGYNAADEMQDPPTNRNVIVDNTMPLGAVLSPGQPYINAMPVISGTAYDPGRTNLPAAYQEGMHLVLVMVKDNNDGTYWNGKTFDTFMSSSNILASGTLNWSTATLVNAAMKDGHSYAVFGKPRRPIRSYTIPRRPLPG